MIQSVQFKNFKVLRDATLPLGRFTLIVGPNGSGLSLKKDVYGTERPSLALETQRATEEARRLSQHLELLQSLFPIGFGSLARDIRNW